MSYLAGKMVLAVEAGAPNNAGADPGIATLVRTKQARIRGATYPYVSAQAVRRWLRDLMEEAGVEPSPVERSGRGARQKVTTAADPVRYADDDLFGYMRAAERAEGADTTVRDSVFMLGTAMSVEPVRITRDFGVRAIADGDPVIHEHEFYTADLVAPFLLDVAHVGVFTVGAGGRHNYLDAQQAGHLKDGHVEQVPFRGRQALALPLPERRRRVAALLEALAELAGGAKRALHYGDRVPALVVMVPMAGGVNPLGSVVASRSDGSGLAVRGDVLAAELSAYAGEWSPPVVVGWRPGWREELRDGFEADIAHLISDGVLRIDHPRSALRQLAEEIQTGVYDGWFATTP
jgi:CRISPR-associated protein Cst2